MSSTLEPPRVDVDRDDVAVADEPDRPAASSLGRDVPDHQPARRAAEAPVGDERDRVAEPAADDRRGDREHLGHAGRARRALRRGRRRPRPAARHRRRPPPCTSPPTRRRAPARGGRGRSWPASLTTAPSGARLPRRTRSAPPGLNGSAIGRDHLAVGLAARRGDARRSCGRRPSARRHRGVAAAACITAAVPPTRWRSPAT